MVFEVKTWPGPFERATTGDGVNKEEFEVIEREVLRLFKDLHAADPLYRHGGKGSMLQRFLGSQVSGKGSNAPTSSTSSMASSHPRSSQRTTSSTSSRFGGFRRPAGPPQRHAFAAEVDEGDEEQLQDDEAEEETQAPMSLEEVLQTEAEGLAEELESAAQDGVDASLLEDLEGSMESAAEALLTMREARNKISEVKRDRGYGKPSQSGGSSPMKSSRVQAKKQSGDHRCWDCDQVGHWQGDPECKKPGAGLGKKNRSGSSPRKGPQRHVQIAEALEVENVDHQDGGGHEALAVQHLPRSASLAAVVAETPVVPKEINMLASSLARDKMLVGALDTACNRTCTGTTWLQSYLKGLEEAPSYVRKLVCRVNEHEVFRFGNGGTQVSHDRWRLPAIIDGTLVCFWTSLVAVPSLGLLLGRDFMDALGTVMHFSKRMVRFEMIGPQQMPLRQLAAGHFMLPLQPADLRWPSAKPQMRWRKLGVDGVVELQLDVKTWWHGKMTCKKSDVSKFNEHMLTESSVSAGHEVCAVMSSSSVLLDRDLSMKPRASVSGGSPTTSSTRTLTPSSTTSCLKASSATDHGKVPSMGAKGENQQGHTKRDKMVKVRPKDDQEVRMACQRRSSLAGAKGLLALCALSIPLGVNMRGMGGASKEDGPTAGLPFASSSRARNHHPALQCCKPGGLHMVEEPDWNPSGFSGRSTSDWNAGGKNKQGNSFTGSQRSLCRSSRTSSHPVSPEQVEECSPRIAGTKRWTSDIEEGFGEAGGILGAASGRKSHGGPVERDSSSPGSSAFRRDLRKLKQHPTGAFSRSTVSRSSPSASSSTSCKFEAFNTQSSRIWDGSRTISSTRRGGHGCAVSDDGILTPSRDDPRGEGRDHGKRDGVSLRAKADSSIWGQLGRPVPRADREGDRPLSSMDFGNHWTSDSELKKGQSSMDFENPWTLDSELKKGQSQLIAEAWKKHEADRLRISKSPRQILEVMEAEYFKEMEQHLNEVFLSTVDLDFDRRQRAPGVFLSEVFTHTQRVMNAAKRRGHRVGTAVSLETGFDLRRPLVQKAVLRLVDDEEPYCLVIAFPCGPFSPLQHLNPHGDPAVKKARLEEGRALLKFAVKLARRQHRAGRHFILENPLPSAAWKDPEMVRLIEELGCYIAELDQCRYGLRSLDGVLHKKPTRLATSSPEVADRLHDRRCLRDHPHASVLGGTKVTARAGHYPSQLARAMVIGLESQFEAEGKKSYEVNAAETEDPGDGFEEDFDNEVPGEVSDSDGEGPATEAKGMIVSGAIKHAVKRLHENTGHRSNRRLARALTLSGAAPEVIWAAKHHQCDICKEKKGPKSRKPVSLPIPRECNDQVHIDMLELFDASDGGCRCLDRRRCWLQIKAESL